MRNDLNTPRPLIDRRHSRSRGFTLLEILVALLILSIGLLGLGALQMTSLRYNHSAFLRSQATLMAQDILDRMRANRDTAVGGSYVTGLTETAAIIEPGTKCVASACSPTAIAAFDLWEWKAGIEELLPGGLAMIRPDGAAPTARWVVEVHWVDQANKRSAGVDLDEIYAQVVLRTEI